MISESNAPATKAIGSVARKGQPKRVISVSVA
jgi:hypothetical protein